MPALLIGSISALVDTSEIQRGSFNEAFAQHGLDWNWERDDYRNLLTSNGGKQRIADFAKEQNEDVDADAVHATKSSIFQKHLANAGIKTRPGIIDAIRAAKGRGWEVGLVTTTADDNITALLDGLDELSRDDFDVVTDVTSVQESKPAGAVYEYAVEQLGEQAGECVAIEDNVGGVRAATAAGIPVVAFPNENTAGHDFGSTPVTHHVDFDELASMAAGH
ncbi:HAD family hydrolase [uncultured Jatrophihabitans sp.]|uniref:HAD family hydrolase n=1 Tax=uncultured Jatrophihabitans sp. TaxID=1610747 RepID=UPI0035CAD5E0